MTQEQIDDEVYDLTRELNESQFYGDLDRQIDIHEKLKLLKENPEEYFKQEFISWYDNLDRHQEEIICPECRHIQLATVVHTLPWPQESIIVKNVN